MQLQQMQLGFGTNLTVPEANVFISDENSYSLYISGDEETMRKFHTLGAPIQVCQLYKSYIY